MLKRRRLGSDLRLVGAGLAECFLSDQLTELSI